MSTGMEAARTPAHLEGALGQVVGELRAGLGEELVSVMLFGGAARGEHTPKHSDTNLLVVMTKVEPRYLRAVATALRRGHKQIRLAPVFLSVGDLAACSDAFAIELTEMQQHRVVLYGRDPLAELAIAPEHLRLQVERELRVKLVRLRQSYLRATGFPRQVAALATASFGSFLALFGALLRVRGEQPAPTRVEMVEQVAATFGVEAELLRRLLAARQGRQPISKAEAEDLFARYLQAVETVAASVDCAGDR